MIIFSLMPDFDIWSFVAGLGIFLLGISQMEGGLKNLAGKSFRHFIRTQTQNPIKAILVGVFITAILQSSSVVSLMVLAFVGAGIIPLRNAIAIILGTNIGTTITGWIVASIGFKFPIDAFALPFLGIGGILITFLSSRVFFSEIGRLLVGFGALFLGLDLMKTAIDVASIETSFLGDISIWSQLFFPIGIIMTAVIQSSSATMAITLSALYAGVIPIEVAAAIVIGSDLGTTTTVLLGGLKGNHVKRQVAYGHVGFNVIAGTVALILLYPILYFVQDILSVEDPLFQLVVFHSSFNLLGVLIVLPFLGKFTRQMERFVKPKKETLSPLLSTVPTEVTEGAIEAMRQEGQDLLERVKTYRYEAFKVDQRGITETMFAKRSSSLLEQYRKIQLKEGELISYYLKVQRNEMSEEESVHIQKLVSAIKNLTLAAKSIKGVMHTVDVLKDGEKSEELALQKVIQEQFSTFYSAIDENNTETDIELIINRAYRENVSAIYNMVENGTLRKDELTSFLHLNSQIKQFKALYWQSQEGLA
ncbi:MAG: Na/Pi cotransporter family protein [Bacteroidota bacterium]